MTVIHNVAGLDDHRIFANRTVASAGHAHGLQALPEVRRFIAELEVPDETGDRRRLDAYLERTRTAAFVVLHEDRIVYERYARGYSEHSLLNSFSIAKPIIATLVGIAHAEGRIPSLESTVADYRPELAATAYGAVTLKALLTMTSGMAAAPGMLPGRAQVYYGDDLHDVVARSTAIAGQVAGWHYSEADVQALGFVLERATGKNLSAYLAEKLWQPLGMEAEALWALDREGGFEKAFCCISARARDFARFGRLYLDRGRIDGRQILPTRWAERRVLPGIRTPYGYTQQHFWWSTEDAQGDYFAYGHSGQYLYVNPKARVVIAKFSETSRQDPVPMFRAVAAAVASPARIAESEPLPSQPVALR